MRSNGPVVVLVGDDARGYVSLHTHTHTETRAPGPTVCNTAEICHVSSLASHTVVHNSRVELLGRRRRRRRQRRRRCRRRSVFV